MLDCYLLRLEIKGLEGRLKKENRKGWCTAPIESDYSVNDRGISVTGLLYQGVDQVAAQHSSET